MVSNLETIPIFTFKKSACFSDNAIEVYADEIERVENRETIYSDLLVQVYFSQNELGDPAIFNNEELECSPLGSLSYYREKIMVSLKRCISDTYTAEARH